MRIHGIHLQGLREPSGEHRISLGPAYNAILVSTPEEARSVIELLCALMYPDTGFGDGERWLVDADARSARAGLSLSFGADAYRLIADLEKNRLVLARHDAGSNQFERVSLDPAEITRCLAAAGLPQRQSFRTLHLCSPDPTGPVSHCAGDEDPEEVDTPTTDICNGPERAEPRERPMVPQELLARLGELREARDRFIRLEREAKRLETEIEMRSPLSDQIDDLDGRIQRFRELLVQRARDIEAVEQQRRGLLDERGRLRGIPPAQVSGMVLGVAIGVLGSVVGYLVQPYFYILALVGLGVALFGLGASRSARRRLGRVEARLAGLRVRERSLEKSFESETAEIRQLVRALSLESSDDLQREAADYRGLLRSSAGLTGDLAQARLGYPEEAESELRALEEWVAGAPRRSEPGDDAGPDPPESEPEPERQPEPVPEVEPPAAGSAPGGVPDVDLDDLVREAAALSGRPAAELSEGMRPALALYLRALTAGAYTRARRGDVEGWTFRREGGAGEVFYEGLTPRDRFRVALAARLALLEILAPAIRIPLIVGPELGFDEPEEEVALARALRRVGSVAQVLHFSSRSGTWTGQAASVHRVSA